MKIGINIILLLISTNFYSQYLEKSESLKKFKKVEIVYYVDKNHKLGWKTKLHLKNGRVNESENYLNNKLTSRTIYLLDSINQLTTEIIKFDINKGNVKDTISEKEITFNRMNQIVQRKFRNGLIEKYSDFNSLNQPKKIERSGNVLDSLSDYKEEIEYNESGTIKKSSSYSKKDTIEIVMINEYKYDEKNNVIEINRKYIPDQEFPIMNGGRSPFPNEKYRYIYNKEGLWTSKFWTINNKEFLIEKRKFN